MAIPKKLLSLLLKKDIEDIYSHNLTHTKTCFVSYHETHSEVWKLIYFGCSFQKLGGKKLIGLYLPLIYVLIKMVK